MLSEICIIFAAFIISHQVESKFILNKYKNINLYPISLALLSIVIQDSRVFLLAFLGGVIGGACGKFMMEQYLLLEDKKSLERYDLNCDSYGHGEDRSISEDGSISEDDSGHDEYDSDGHSEDDSGHDDKNKKM